MQRVNKEANRAMVAVLLMAVLAGGCNQAHGGEMCWTATESGTETEVCSPTKPLPDEVNRPAVPNNGCGSRIRLEADEVGVGMTLIPCSVDGLPAFIARTDKNESGSGRHARNIVELVAGVRLRDVLQGSDGDRVEIVVP